MSGCIFCRIVKKEIPAQVVYESSALLAFRDLQPQAPIHILIIPKKHVAKVMDMSTEDMATIAEVHRVAQDLARQNSVDESGFRLVVNNGPHAGQAVDHLHYHFLAGRKFGWPPG